ncbi:MAG: hypothetical protein HY645_10805 [Acidobacteria bacterium]|nr:hypothetical protein [Acidobacteriota bacterium]
MKHAPGLVGIVPRDLKSVLVIRGGGLGDFLLILPLLNALREGWPLAKIHVMGRSSHLDLVVDRHYADAGHSIDQAGFSSFFRPLSETELDQLPFSHFLKTFNLVVSFLNDREGLLEGNLQRLGIPVLMIPSPKEDGVPAVQQFASIAEAAGIVVSDLQPRLYLKQDDDLKARALLQDFGQDSSNPTVALHPGSGNPRKNWPAEKFARLADWLAKDCRVQLLLISGEADGEAVRAFLSHWGKAAPPLLDRLPVRLLAGVLKQCRLLIGNDSGISHLASASGTALVAFFGPTDPRVWQPSGEKSRALPFEAPEDILRKTVLELLKRS